MKLFLWSMTSEMHIHSFERIKEKLPHASVIKLLVIWKPGHPSGAQGSYSRLHSRLQTRKPILIPVLIPRCSFWPRIAASQNYIFIAPGDIKWSSFLMKNGPQTIDLRHAHHPMMNHTPSQVHTLFANQRTKLKPRHLMATAHYHPILV